MGDEAETRAAKTYPLFGFGFRRSFAGHVLAIRTTTEGRQRAPLLAHFESRRRAGGRVVQPPGFVSGRDQR